jgi:hypothetical protein
MQMAQQPTQQCKLRVDQLRPPFPLAPALVQAGALTANDLQHVKVDKMVIEAAMQENLRSSRLSARPVRWFADARSARAHLAPYEPRPTFWPLRFPHRRTLDAAWTAITSRRAEAPTFGPWALPSRRADFQADGRQAFSVEPLKHPSALGPLLTALLAGLLAFRIGRKEVVCVPRPLLWVGDGQLHRADGPAVKWATAERYFFWRGTQVPDWFIEQPQRITCTEILSERNAELRRCMIERLGPARFLAARRERLLDRDKLGAIWKVVGLAQQVVYCAGEVENGTREADGTRRRYFLQVPPWMSSAREAVAWTYGLRTDQYHIATRT